MVKKIETINLHELVGKSVSTINRGVRNFCRGSGISDDDFEAFIARFRKIKTMIQNDADSTMRMIQMRPEKEAGYMDLWAACANKLVEECGMMLSKAIGGESTFEPDDDFTRGDLSLWTSCPEPQKETPTPLEAAAAVAEPLEVEPPLDPEEVG